MATNRSPGCTCRESNRTSATVTPVGPATAASGRMSSSGARVGALPLSGCLVCGGAVFIRAVVGDRRDTIILQAVSCQRLAVSLQGWRRGARDVAPLWPPRSAGGRGLRLARNDDKPSLTAYS